MKLIADAFPRGFHSTRKVSRAAGDGLRAGGDRVSIPLGRFQGPNSLKDAAKSQWVSIPLGRFQGRE